MVKHIVKKEKALSCLGQSFERGIATGPGSHSGCHRFRNSVVLVHLGSYQSKIGVSMNQSCKMLVNKIDSSLTDDEKHVVVRRLLGAHVLTHNIAG